MASIALAAAGTAIGGSIGGTVLGISAAAIGGAIGSAAGAAIDAWIIQGLTPTEKIEGTQLDTLRVTTSTEGAVIQRVFGKMRVAGNIIFATDFIEKRETETQGGKGGGGGGGVEIETFTYSCSFAVGICEGVVNHIGRVWADGDEMDLDGVNYRIYYGDDEQMPDPLIEAFVGAGETPAYRGLAYIVFENLQLENFGNRIPQLTFEVFKPVVDDEAAEGAIRGVTMIPATGESAYATSSVRQGIVGTATTENINAIAGRTDFNVSLDQLEALAPACDEVSLVVSWFGTDLRAGNCNVRPKVDLSAKFTIPAWSVNGVVRGTAQQVSYVDGKPAFGSTPSDASIVQAITELKNRNKTVTFYPFIMMDIADGNTLPDPYSDNAATNGQPVYPWRGRITCSPAAEAAGTVDQTAAATTQIDDFFGNATVGNFNVSGTSVSFTGSASEWGYRRMVLHYAHLCAAAGGVDTFIIGSELRGITRVRGAGNTFPAVAQLISLAADVRQILGSGVDISYAADWSEYFGHQPGDGSGDVFFHLDPLWSDSNINFVGIDNYMPLSDWRDGIDHIDAQTYPSIYDRAYLQSNIAGGEGFDWFYASDLDRANQTRTPITDGAGKPWVFRYKDLHSWWTQQHYDRPLGVEAGAPTSWVPQSKPFRFTEFGCPATDRATNQPNVFSDPKSSESFFPYFSRGYRDDAIQRAYIESVYGYWNNPANNPTSTGYAGPMVDIDQSAVWTWDARPYPFFPARNDIWSDSENWRLGHWLTGRVGSVSVAAIVKALCIRSGYPADRIDVSGLRGAVEGYTIPAIEAARSSIATLARHFGFDAVESEGVLRFVMRGNLPQLTINPDGMVGGADQKGEMFEQTREQSADLPAVLKWNVLRSDAEYDSAPVDAQRGVADSSRVVAESFAFAVPPEEAQRRCARALFEQYVAIEGLMFALPPSLLALDPTDVVLFDHDGRQSEFRLNMITDGPQRKVESVRQDRFAYDLPNGGARPATVRPPTQFGPPQSIFMNLPQLADTIPAHQPYLAAYADPWPGLMAVYKSPTLDGFTLNTTIAGRAVLGTLDFSFFAGPTDVFDMGNELYVTLDNGTLSSVTDDQLFQEENAFAIETSPGEWEVLQAGVATLIGVRRYRLTRLLRGLKGTEGNMGNPTSAGARFVVLDSAYALPITESEVGLPYNWRIGPSQRDVGDDTYTAAAFTPAGQGLKPYAPVVPFQPFKKSRAVGDFLIEWNRRDRALIADVWDVGEPPMSESVESYEVDIIVGGSVVRTLASATQSVNYTAAMQNADLGSTLAPGDSLQLRVYQLSSRVGRGDSVLSTLFF